MLTSGCRNDDGGYKRWIDASVSEREHDRTAACLMAGVLAAKQIFEFGQPSLHARVSANTTGSTVLQPPHLSCSALSKTTEVCLHVLKHL